MDKEDRDYWLISFSVTTASSEHSNYLYNSSVESINTLNTTIIQISNVDTLHHSKLSEQQWDNYWQQ